MSGRTRASTRENLLRAAGEVFLEHGYAGASIREIARRAEANLAAVNYHFGSKEGLYRELLSQTYSTLTESVRMPRIEDFPGEPEAALDAWVHWHVRRVFGPENVFANLFVREIQDPSPVFSTFLDLSMRPVLGALLEMVAAILDRPVEDPEVRHAGMSIIGQYVLYRQCEAAMEHLMPEHRWTEATIEALADRVATFALGGLRALARRDA